MRERARVRRISPGRSGKVFSTDGAGGASRLSTDGPRTPVLLGLQRRVGNAATSRVALSWIHREAAAREEPKQAGKGGYRMTVPDVGTFEILSWSLDAPRGKGQDEETSHDLVVTKAPDKHTAVLTRFAAEGRNIERVLLEGEGMVVEATDVIIAAFQTSEGGGEPTESLTLNAGALKWGKSE